jgi:formate dehydrogenase subunit gamma
MFGIILIALNVITPFIYAAETNKTEKIGNNSATVIQQIGVKSPGTDLWREVRQRDANIIGLSQVKTPNAGTLIDTKGNQWREFRMEWLLPYGGYFLIGALAFLGLLFLLVRRSKIPEGRSGKKIRRMTNMQVISHWFMVALIGFMSLTGLLLLFGRFVIIPLMGADAFSPIASASKEGHNLMGPLVVISLLLMLIYFLRYNWPAKGDLKWLFTLGGLLSKKHLEVGFFNAGEKMLFWLTIVLGIILSVSGLLLLFPYYEQTIDRTQLALLIHAIAALILIALAFGHIWMVITVEGTVDAMKDGNVDENWAKSHHSRWYKEASHSKISNSETPDLKAGSSEPNQEGAY